MLTIVVGGEPTYDEATETFGSQGGVELQLEHSLVSLSKWESKHEVPFLDKKEKTTDEALDYVRCMVLTENPPEDFVQKLYKENMEAVNEYIDRKMTATFFHDLTPKAKRKTEVVTAEMVYYWMTVFHIDWEAQYWHLNRLFALIRICNLKQDNKPQKMSRAEAAARQKALNEQRKKQYGTKG